MRFREFLNEISLSGDMPTPKAQDQIGRSPGINPPGKESWGMFEFDFALCHDLMGLAVGPFSKRMGLKPFDVAGIRRMYETAKKANHYRMKIDAGDILTLRDLMNKVIEAGREKEPNDTLWRNIVEIAKSTLKELDDEIGVYARRLCPYCRHPVEDSDYKPYCSHQCELNHKAQRRLQSEIDRLAKEAESEEDDNE